MELLSPSKIEEVLRCVGVQEGDLTYVASYMPILGNGPALLQDTVDALQAVVGEMGTIVMPVFNWDYCRDGYFNLETTPSQCGVLTEFFRTMPGVLRSATPPWCTFCVWGERAQEIVQINGSSAFGSDGITQYLYDNNCRYVVIGCPLNDAVIHTHWLEEMFEVPYRYWKQFRGKIETAGLIMDDVSYMYARPQTGEIDIDTTPLTDVFQETDKVSTYNIGFGAVRSFLVKDYVDFMSPYFEKDKTAILVSN